MGKHSEDRETIIHEVIPVIVIKLNYVKQLQDLKKSSAWNIYKKPCSMRNCSVAIPCPVHNHRLLQNTLRSQDPRHLVVINYLKCLKRKKKIRFWCFMMGTLPHSGDNSILRNICGLRPVISLIYFYTCNVFDDDTDNDAEIVQEQLAVLTEEIHVKMMLDEIMRDTEGKGFSGELQKLSVLLLRFSIFNV